MKRFCFRLAIARPDVGFDYFGSWYAYNPAPVLDDARRILEQSPFTVLRLQINDGEGIQVDLRWDVQWLLLLRMRNDLEMRQNDWNRIAINTFMAAIEQQE